ncbi:peptide chain release factor N(5)-glutamine methyltransferase [Halanaerobacter jeridensis]|uniref:Release factor glutamine methyltransferase n=1 Tax=Halanaerobacter jeridensis TaxID=706427 RepID=A0A939BPL8_9FIRM|nr:release factor glutamine methyltransferase [Halanaerobacter jeridensis]
MPKLNIKEILDKTVDYFEKYDIAQPRLDAEVLLADLLDMERINLYVNFDRPLSPDEVDTYRELILKRRQGTPVAYLVGEKEFMGLKFKVNSDVLIPRPETEHLVQSILNRIDTWEEEEVKIADIGTGSGAIIISIAKLADKLVQGIAIDISESSLAIAQENAANLEVEEQLEFKEGNLLEPLDEKVDIIVSNPPYIPSGEIDGLQEEVQQEPSLALDGGQDGLDYYRKIIDQAVDYLTTDGLIIFEVGIEQSQDVADLLKKRNYSNIEIKKDYSDIERVVLAKYN